MFAQIALFVIGVAGNAWHVVSRSEGAEFHVTGFGRRISWTDDQQVPPGHEITFKDALHTVSTHVVLRLVTPKWAFGLSEELRKTRQAYDELEV